MTQRVIQIEGIEASYLLERFDDLSRQIKELKENQKPTAPKTDFITRSEVCKIFHISVVTASEWSKKGILKTYKIGNRIFYKRSEIENALTEIHTRQRFNK